MDEAPRGRKRLRTVAAVAVLAALVAAYRAWLVTAPPADAPVIGVSLDTAWHSRLGITSSTYATALARVGGRTLEIRPGEMGAEEILDRIDGLLLTGGGDVDPALYGGDEPVILVDRARDELEIALVRGAVERGMPVLGICRGIQLVAVAFGGTLRTTRDTASIDDVHGIRLDSLRAHDVEIAEGSALARMHGAGTKRVNSFHGQVVSDPGALRISARAADGVVEALEHPDHPFLVALQWHPEILSMERTEELVVFEELVRLARAAPGNRAPARDRSGGPS